MKKEVKIVKTKTAIIILMIEVIILMSAVLYCTEKYHQKIYPDVPTVSVYCGDNKIAEMLPVSYTWYYDKNEDPKLKKFEGNIEEYDFSEENIIFLDTNLNGQYYEKMDERHKFDIFTRNNTNFYKDYSKRYLKGWPFDYYNIGEHYIDENFRFIYQGNVSYALKVLAFDGKIAKIAKGYLDTKLTETEKINELVKKLNYNEFLVSAKVEGKNLILEYEYYITEVEKNFVRMNNLTLFACMPELEKVTYVAKNNKVENIDPETHEPIKSVHENVVYTREEVNSVDDANIENLKKYINQF